MKQTEILSLLEEASKTENAKRLSEIQRELKEAIKNNALRDEYLEELVDSTSPAEKSKIEESYKQLRVSEDSFGCLLDRLFVEAQRQGFSALVGLLPFFFAICGDGKNKYSIFSEIDWELAGQAYQDARENSSNILK